MKKILMVCLGNICRSPLAEGLLKAKVNPAHVSVDSAGTGNYHIGERPDSRSIAVARKYGIDIAAQRCRQFSTACFAYFDLIYAMDQSNYLNLLSLTQNPDHSQRVKLILEELYPGKNCEVPDPYPGGAAEFEAVYRMLDQVTDKISENLQL